MQKIKGVIGQINVLDKDAMKQARERQDSLTKPRGSLGILEDLSVKVAGITGNPRPRIRHKVIFTMAGDHGVTQEGVSAFPKEVTPQMVYNFIREGAGINVLAEHVGAKVVVVDMGVGIDLEPGPGLVIKKIAHGTKNMAKGPAMTHKEAIKCIGAGIEVFEAELERGIDIVGTGDMGIGNTTPSSAIAAAITGRDVRDVTGRGTGIDDKAFERKVKVIERSLNVNKPDPDDAIDVLSKVGGFEIGGIAGVILAGAKNRIPVVIDGFISGAAALIATKLEPRVKDYLIAAHCSVETGHRIVLDYMGLSPILNLNLRLGEGTGAALGMSIVEAGVKILNEMATFDEAEVSEARS